MNATSKIFRPHCTTIWANFFPFFCIFFRDEAMSFSPPRIPKDSPSYLIWSIFSKEREERAKKHKKGQKAGQRTKSADRSPMSNLHNKVSILFMFWVINRGTWGPFSKFIHNTCIFDSSWKQPNGIK